MSRPWGSKRHKTPTHRCEHCGALGRTKLLFNVHFCQACDRPVAIITRELTEADLRRAREAQIALRPPITE